MNQSPYDLNRAVHLARSEVLFEWAQAHVQACLNKDDLTGLERETTAAIYFLEAALEHTDMASKSSRANPQEKSFVHFLHLALCYLYSAHALAVNEKELKNTSSQLWQFLARAGEGGGIAGFSRSSQQLLQDVAHLFAMAQAPFRALRETLLAQFDESERQRHQLAQADLREKETALQHHSQAHFQVRPNFLSNSLNEM